MFIDAIHAVTIFCGRKEPRDFVQNPADNKIPYETPSKGILIV